MNINKNFGSINIRKGTIYNLDISWDINYDAALKYHSNPGKAPNKVRVPCFLFTPDMKDADNHFHIELTRKEARKLKNWLERFFK